MSRQQAFEAIYAKQHDVPAESLVQYRFKFKDGYSLPRIASHYRTYCETLDSIVVELPLIHRDNYANSFGFNCANEAIEMMKSRLAATGVKYK